MMKSMKIVSTQRPWSVSKAPLVSYVVSSGHGHVQVSQAHQLWNAKHIKFGISYDHLKPKPKFIKGATAFELPENEHDSRVGHPKMTSKVLTFEILYKFSRVFTQIGTALAITSVSLLAIQNISEFTPSYFLGVLQALLGGSLANLYTSAINQLTDIEIDKINKPYYVLASGELSIKNAILLTSLYAFLGLCVGWTVKSWPLKLGLFLYYGVGTAYSVHLPLLRWKRNPVLAAMTILSIHGLIVPILFHLHAQTCITGRTLLFSKHAIFVSGIMSIYSIVFALFKDIPDLEGDKMNGISSLASKIGPKPVFWICICLLEMVYGMAVLIGLSSTRFWVRLIMVIGHSILGLILWRNANMVDIESNEATESFYQFMHKLYYVHYLLVPMLRF